MHLKWLLVPLAAIVFFFQSACSDLNPPITPDPGSIQVLTNDNPQSPWRLFGSSGLDTTGNGPALLENLEAGDYRIEWLELDGWFLPTTPDDQLSKTLQPGKSLVFSGFYKRYIRLTTDPGTDSEPVWSPDGNQIAFSSDRSGNLDIWVLSLDENHEVLTQDQITTGATDDHSPDWSGDGNRIIFGRDSGRVAAIPWVSPDGTETGEYNISSSCQDTFYTSPTLSPDGSWIGCVSSPRGGGENITIFQTDYYSCTQLSNNCDAWDGILDSSWANISDQIAFSFYLDAGFFSRIGILKTDNSQCTVIVAGPYFNHDPNWSPDDQYICFSSTRNDDFNNREIWTTRATPNHPLVQITDEGYDDHSPSWSPDGKTIAFASDRGGDGNMDIWLVSVPSLE